MKIHDLLCENSGFSAPKARNVTAWAIGPGGVWLRFLALKARNESGTSEILNVFSRDSLFRAFSASGIVMTFTQALPWAITFRAFGAENPEFSHKLYRRWF